MKVVLKEYVKAVLFQGLDAEGIFTHFAVSDEFGEEYESYTKHQFELFTSVIDEVEKNLERNSR